MATRIVVQEMTFKKGAEILVGEISKNQSCKVNCSDGTGNSVAMEPNSTATLEYALSAEGLYEALQKCVHGTNWKTSVASFELNAMKKCISLSEKITSGTYQPRPLKTFDITRPKRRTCTAIGIYDRVYQRSLNDNIVYPKVVKHLIKENCACQKGKGTDYARKLLKRHLFRLNYNQGTSKSGYALCIDISKYYPSMRHDVVLNMFQRYLLPEEFKHVKKIIEHQYPGEVGFTPGSQLIQIAGIAVLNKLDHYIKEQLRIKYYIRYMDDFILIHESKEYLKHCLNEITAKLDEMKFSVNKSKTQLINVYKVPVPFLGFTFKLHKSGKIDVRIKSSKFKEQKRRCKRLSKVLPSEKMNEVATQAVNYLDKNNTDKRYVKEYLKVYNEVRKEAA